MDISPMLYVVPLIIFHVSENCLHHTCNRKCFRAQLRAKSLSGMVHEDDAEMNRDQLTEKCKAMCSELRAKGTHHHYLHFDSEAVHRHRQILLGKGKVSDVSGWLGAVTLGHWSWPNIICNWLGGRIWLSLIGFKLKADTKIREVASY